MVTGGHVPDRSGGTSELARGGPPIGAAPTALWLMNRCRGARGLRAGELRTEEVDARRRSRDRADRVIGDGRERRPGRSGFRTVALMGFVRSHRHRAAETGSLLHREVASLHQPTLVLPWTIAPLYRIANRGWGP